MEQLYDIKTQLVAGREVLTDMTVDPIPGKEQGDHRKTLTERSNVSRAVADTVLALGPAVNAAAANKDMLALLEEVGIPKADLLKGLSLLMGEDVTDAEYVAIQVRLFKHD